MLEVVEPMVEAGQAEQVTWPPRPMKEPPGQGVHLALPLTAATEPGGHAVHAVEPGEENFPALHRTQFCVPTFENLPALHTRHDVSPLERATLPGKHGKQLEAAVWL